MVVYPWARMMVKLCARACVITQLTGLSQLDTRNLWREIAGDSSPSGQQPNDLNWYTKTPQRRAHAALLVRLYGQAARGMPEYAAYPHAFYHYARMTASPAESFLWLDSGDPAFRTSEKDYIIPFSRGYFLVQSYTEERFASGRRKCELEIRRCRKCQGQYMAHINEGGVICPVCAKETIG